MNLIDFRSLLDSGSDDEPTAPVVLNGRELQNLLSPITCDEFANFYFSGVSLSVKGHPHKFEDLFGWKKLKQALARGRKVKDKRFNLMASFAGGEADGSVKPMFEAQLSQVSELLSAGATICITNIHMADPDLARWAEAIRGQLNFAGTVGVNCYVSPDGSGLPMHYDKRFATTLQISGKKRWRYSTEPAKPWPDNNAVYKEGRVEPTGIDAGKHPDEMDFREIELNPGDLLCLPAGAWHAARGLGHSLALNLYFAPRNLFDQLLPVLTEFAASHGNWRGGPPPTIENTHGQMPETVSTYMRERLDELHKKIVELMQAPEALSPMWLNALMQQPYTGWQPDPVRPLPTATSADRFRVAVAPLRFIVSRDKLIVPCDNALLNFPIHFAPILERLASAPASFSVPEALSWQQEDNRPHRQETIACLQVLYQHRILEMA